MTEVLTIPATAIQLPERSSAWTLQDLSSLHPLVWRDREQAETDENWLQLIPYVVLHDGRGCIWCYRRTGGDERLREQRSCGLGGHVEQEDEGGSITNTLLNGAHRELEEELADALSVGPLRWIGCLYEGESAIGRVHLGVLFTARWQGGGDPEIAAGEPMESLHFHSAREIVADDRFELWSRLSARFLHQEQLL